MPQYFAPAQKQLTDLPVELLAEVYLAALSPDLPLVCRHIYNAVKSFPPSVHAQYLLLRHPHSTNSKTAVEQSYLSASQLTRSLRYPLCTLIVFKAMCRISSSSNDNNLDNNTGTSVIRRLFELPRRLFRGLDDTGDSTFGPDSDPLPFLRFLWEKHPSKGVHMPTPNPNSNNGYPLVRAVHARFTPLIRFLLDCGADPGQRESMAVRVAIGKRDLELVKMLVEFPSENSGAKRRKRVDRVAVEPFMFNLAVRCDARDIVQYFMQEKGCIPDMRTLKAF